MEECRKCYTDPSSLRKHILAKHGEGEYERLKKIKPVVLAERKRRHCSPPLSYDIGREVQIVFTQEQLNVLQQIANQVTVALFL